MQVRKPHRLNVVGDFYIENGCCTACGMPEHEAPALFAWDQEQHCYVSKQPANPDEVRGMLNAIGSADLRCIRYKGRDPALLKALAEMGEIAVRSPRSPNSYCIDSWLDSDLVDHRSRLSAGRGLSLARQEGPVSSEAALCDAGHA
jgi:hypothetical protein